MSRMSDEQIMVLLRQLLEIRPPTEQPVAAVHTPPATWEMPLEEARMIGVIAQKHRITQEQALLLMIRQCYRYVIEQGGQLT